jgi:hypothetical protein
MGVSITYQLLLTAPWLHFLLLLLLLLLQPVHGLVHHLLLWSLHDQHTSFRSLFTLVLLPPPPLLLLLLLQLQLVHGPISHNLH